MKTVNILRVTLEYRGACRIPQGEYLADDPALNGLASMLLNNGHAVVIGQKEIETPEVSAPVGKGMPPPKPVTLIAHKNQSRRRRT